MTRRTFRLKPGSSSRSRLNASSMVICHLVFGTSFPRYVLALLPPLREEPFDMNYLLPPRTFSPLVARRKRRRRFLARDHSVFSFCNLSESGFHHSPLF